ncbi:MAG: ribosomal protein S18-alanine N-acetyltransferase [Clostridia bacterium]|nr:ribosomal protein S18-alanine N-acetyltransferase [Clostridia bacterium]
MDGICIVPMSKELLEDICKIEEECFSAPWKYDMLVPELSNPSARFFVALFNGDAAGYCGMYNICGECSMANIAVLPEYRRRGIADALLKRIEQTAIKENAEFLTLEVRKSNAAAISLYDSHGFVKVGERKNYYSSPTENAYLMTLYFKENRIEYSCN